MLTALQHYAILGLTTNIEFLLHVLCHPMFVAGETHTGFIPEYFPHWHKAVAEHTAEAVVAVALSRLQKRDKKTVQGSGGEKETLSPWQSLGSWRVGA
jgi:acetyl/propionyl-CoA carboxylase alpha subunit